MTDPASNGKDRKNGAAHVMDTREIVRRHLEDPTHVITAEEMEQVVISTEHIDVANHPLVKAFD